MGVSNIASGGIILVVLVIVLMTMPKLLDSTLLLQDASTEITDLEDEITKTEINVNTITAPTTNNDEISFSIDNEGEEKLWNYEKFNVIITYDPASGRVTESLSYEGDCGVGQPTQGMWCNDGIATDLLDPDILNSGESMDVRATVADDFATGAAIVIVSTDNGVIGTDSVAVP